VLLLCLQTITQLRDNLGERHWMYSAALCSLAALQEARGEYTQVSNHVLCVKGGCFVWDAVGGCFVWNDATWGYWTDSTSVGRPTEGPVANCSSWMYSAAL
jgi:hypothetical protein